MNQAESARILSLYVVRHAASHNQRTGQYLFNMMGQLKRFITASTFDPFYKEMSQYQIEAWLLEHVIFDDHGQIIAFFNNDQILWEKR